MPLRPIEFAGSGGGGNALLQGIINGQNMSLTSALSGAVQLTRDASSNQLAQENTLLEERRFDRTFRESQRVDERNFDRSVFSGDRAFSEGVRQFNIVDKDRDASLNLRAELGRGQLGIATENLNLNRDRTELAIRRGEAELSRHTGVFKQEDMDREQVADLRSRAEIANDPVAFAAQTKFEGIPAAEVEVIRARELENVGLGFNLVGFPQVGKNVSERAASADLLPPRTRQDTAASALVIKAAQQSADGDLPASLVTLARAAETASEGSPEQAAIIQQKVITAAQLSSTPELSESLVSAITASEIYAGGMDTVFSGTDSTFAEEVEAVLSSDTASGYARTLAAPKRREDKLTKSQSDARAKKRLEFYYSVKNASPSDLIRARSKGDPHESYLKDLLPTPKDSR